MQEYRNIKEQIEKTLNTDFIEDMLIYNNTMIRLYSDCIAVYDYNSSDIFFTNTFYEQIEFFHITKTMLRIDHNSGSFTITL